MSDYLTLEYKVASIVENYIAILKVELAPYR